MSVSWATSRPEDLRAHHARDAAERAGPLPPDVAETVLAQDGAFRGGLLFTPAEAATDAVMVYFHGGGFVAGSPATHRGVTAWLARFCGMRVLSARYRLAPEHPFPAQREDAVAAVAAAGSLSGGPDARLVLAGDSAGACVAAWGLSGLAPTMRARIRGLVLFYGAYGLVESPSIARRGTAENGLDSHTLSVMYRRLGETSSLNAPAWPLGFAHEITEPAYVLAAGLDAVFDDSATLYETLGPLNPANRFVVVEEQDHGFLKGASRDSVAMRELEGAARWVAARRIGEPRVRGRATDPA